MEFIFILQVTAISTTNTEDYDFVFKSEILCTEYSLTIAYKKLLILNGLVALACKE